MKRRTALPKPTDRYALGDAKVSPYCLGWVQEPETVLAAFDLGINFFFLSGDLHFATYDQTRRGIDLLLSRRSGIRDEIVVGIAGYFTEPSFFLSVFNDVRYWQTALPFQLAIIGGCRTPGDFTPRRDALQTSRHRLEFWQGGAMGASFHSRRLANEVIPAGLLDIAFVRYNAAHPNARQDLFPAIPHPRSTLVYNFANSVGYVSAQDQQALGVPKHLWKPELHDHYRFVLTRSELDGMLCAPKTVRDVEKIAVAVERGPLDPDEEEFLIELAALQARASGSIAV